MGARGPKAEPLAFKRRPGAVAAPVSSAPLDLAPPPELTFDELAVAEWTRIAPDLVAGGLVVALDRGALIGYCQAWSRYQRAKAEAAAQPFVLEHHTGPRVHPVYAALEQCHNRVLRAAEALGLTPVSRAKVRALPAAPAAAAPVGKWGGLLK